jgi:hypothetical protein
MADHFEFSIDEDFDVFEDAENGLDDHPPDSGSVMPPDGGDFAVSSGPSGPGPSGTRPEGSPPLVEELVTVINLSDDDSPPDRRPARHRSRAGSAQKVGPVCCGLAASGY